MYFTLRALAISQVLSSHMWLTKQLHKIPYLRYNKLEAVGKPKKCLSLVPQGTSFNHQVSLMAQLSHVLWLKDSKTNPDNLTGTTCKYVCV